MRIRNRAVVLAALITLAMPTTALAGKPSGSDSGNAEKDPATIVIDGREYGPRDGLKTDTWQIEMPEGSGSVGAAWEGSGSSGAGGITPMIAWGSSYAWSTETLNIRYDGRAKAGANIWDGLRIVQVCIWYTRNGVTVGDRVCSKATSANGINWTAGPEVTTWCWDAVFGTTYFNWSLSRIRTGV